MFILRLFVFVVIVFSIGSAQTLPRAERLLSITITEASNKDYGYAFTLAKDAGMQVTGFSLKWDELETAPYTYASDPDWLEIINDFFPTQDIAVSLMIGPIDTNNLRLPADLADKSFDDPEVIERFKRLLDHVFTQIPDLELSSLSIGNEIDGYLGTDQQLWKEYTTFFQEVSAYARSKRPGLVVGSKIGFGGLTGNSRALAADIVRASDAVMVTYYPLHNDFSVRNPEVVHEDFATLVGLYTHKPIYILEAGYPSSPLLGSSEEKQADFVREIFKAWDTYAEHIKVLDFLWLHDIPETVVEELGVYYRWQDEKFLAYLATLGLRTQQGQDKAAFETLQLEASQRGWCVASVKTCGVQKLSNWVKWTKHPEPVYVSPDSGFAASDPSIFYEDGTYHLYYTDVDNQVSTTIISLATSKDGIEWSFVKRLLEVNKSNWDAAHESAAIWKEVGKPYHLFYIGYKPNEYPPVGFYPADLGLAVSENTNGEFKKLSDEPILRRTEGWYDGSMIASPDIIKIGETYYMVYAGHCYEKCEAPPGVRLLGATSKDLVHWTKHEIPVLEANPELPWMVGFVGEPALLAAPNGKYYLFFTAFVDGDGTPPVIGLAESDTPFGPWEINPEPILVGTEDWESAWVGAPDVLLEGDTVKMWYMGIDEEGYYRVGYATAPWPLRNTK